LAVQSGDSLHHSPPRQAQKGNSVVISGGAHYNDRITRRKERLHEDRFQLHRYRRRQPAGQ
jgi:hypothetical protein